MSKGKETVVSMLPVSGNGFDIGNTGANVATFVVPFRCELLQLVAWSNTAVANSFTVTADSYNGTTQGAADCGSVVVPDSTAALALVVDTLSTPVTVNAGSKILVQVDEAGDSGEKGFVSIVVSPEPETVANSTLLTESA